MEFTVYTFGDVEIFRAALAGVAMIFNADGFFVSDGGLGLGALTALGLLLGLMVILVNGIITQKIELGGFIVMVIVFSILFVPKFSVNVEDYNGDAIAKVDNVPLGVALPAGLVSGLAREMNIRMGTAFSTVQGYPSGLMTPEALSSPLKMLLSLRNGYQVLPERNPVLVMNMANLVAYCLAGRELGTPNFQSIKIKDAPITALLEAANTVNGLTLYADPETRISSLRPCKDAALSIDTAINTLADSSDLTEILTAAAARKRAAPIRVTAGVPEVLPVTASIQADNLAMLFQVNANAADNFIKTTLLMPYISRAYLCADASSDPVSWAQCMPFQSSITQAQEDSAAAGTTFQRMMFHGMNALFFIWICLSPVVAVLMLMMGVKGLKLAGSYLMFGAWTVSWYIGASVVNFYMLKQLQYELSMLGTLDNLTPTTIGWFFDTISTKFAAAGEMMAAVPLIMMTVMSGSMYGMVQLANRWGSRDYYDEKVNTPSTFASAPMMQMQSGVTMKHGSVTAFNENMGHGQNFTAASNQAMANTFAKESATEATKKLSSGLSHMLDRAKTDKHAYQKAVEFADKLDKTGNTEVASAWRNAVAATQDKKHDFGAKKEAFERAAWGGQASFGSTIGRQEAAGGGTSGDTATGKSSFGGKAHADWQQGVGQSTQQGSSDAVTEKTDVNAALDEKSGVKRSHGFSLGDLQKVAHEADNTFRDSNGASWTSEFADAAKYSEKATEALSVAGTLGGQQTVSDVEMANKIWKSPQAAASVDGAHAEYMRAGNNSLSAIAYRADFNRSEAMYSGIVDPVARQHVRELHALQAASVAEGGRPGSATATYLEALGTAAGMHVDLHATTTLTADSKKHLETAVAHETAPAANLKAPRGSTKLAENLPTEQDIRGRAKKSGVNGGGIPTVTADVRRDHDTREERAVQTGRGMAASNANQANVTDKGKPAIPAAFKRAGEALDDMADGVKKLLIDPRGKK